MHPQPSWYREDVSKRGTDPRGRAAITVEQRTSGVIVEPINSPLSADPPHEPGDSESWQESNVLGWADTEQQIGGFMRTGHQPNRCFTKCCFAAMSRNGNSYTRSTQNLPWRPHDATSDTFAATISCPPDSSSKGVTGSPLTNIASSSWVSAPPARFSSQRNLANEHA